MKNFLKSASAFVLMLGAAVMLFTACDKKGGNSGGNGDVDKTKLEALIIECEALLDGATADDYPEANIEAFTNAVNDAKAIRDNQNATQSQVDLMTNNLTLAKETFVGSKYESIPDSSVIAFFDFETINDQTGGRRAAGRAGGDIRFRYRTSVAGGRRGRRQGYLLQQG